MDAPKRRLPVLNSPAGAPDEGPARKPWQWMGFGALAIVTTWVPLAAMAAWVAGRLAARADGEGAAGLGTAIAIAGLFAVALGLGAALGGMLVGRWGPPGVGVREAALAGLAAAAVAGALTCVTFGPSAGAVLLALVAVPAAAAGGRAGMRWR
jgi:hypothetical protein